MQRAEISFSHGQCVDLGVLIPAELVPVNDKWLKNSDDLFLQAGLAFLVKLKSLSKFLDLPL